MFLGLGLIIIITLVVAGVGRLLSIVLLAMVGIFPKKETTPIVQLPPSPARVPVPVNGNVESPQPVASPLDDLAYLETGSTTQVPAPATVAPTAKRPAPAAKPAKIPSKEPAAAVAPAESTEPVAPKRDLLGDVRRRLSGASAAVKDGAWKAKVDPRNLPKPAEVKSVVEHQTAHHPIVVAATKEPPVLAKDWADAVAKADERAAARAKAGQPPAIKVTVRDLGEPTPSSNGKTPGPKQPDIPAKKPGNAPAKPADSKSPAQGNGAKNTGPNPSKNGKTPSPIRKGSLSSASRNS
nr:hypothetical protein [Paenarthrobacter aurescens]